MKRVQKAVNQAPETLVWENLFRLSKDFNVPLVIDYAGGKEVIGFPFRILHRNLLYVRLAKQESDSVERHVLVNMDTIDAIEFETEPGILDDIWNIV